VAQWAIFLTEETRYVDSDNQELVVAERESDVETDGGPTPRRRGHEGTPPR